MGLIKDIAGVALAPATGGASLAMTGRQKKRGSADTDDPGAAGQDVGSDSDSSSGESPLAGVGRLAKRIGKRLADKGSSR